MASMETYSSTLLDGGDCICTPAWVNHAGLYADYHRLYFPRTGEAQYWVSGKTWTLKPGRIYLFPGYQLARYSCPHRMTAQWMHFRADNVEMDSEITHFKEGLSWPAKEWSFWKPVYSNLQQLFTARPPALLYRTQAMLTWLYSEVLAAEETARRRRPEAAAGVLPAHAVTDGIQFIHDHFLENPSLKEIAASVHLSPIYFHRCFKQTFRLTPHEYLMRRRMYHAWNLLRSGVSVADVAARLKFGTSFYFSRAFKRFFRTTPIKVRLGKVPHQP